MHTQEITKKVWVKPELKPLGDVVKGGMKTATFETKGSQIMLS